MHVAGHHGSGAMRVVMAPLGSIGLVRVVTALEMHRQCFIVFLVPTKVCHFCVGFVLEL